VATCVHNRYPDSDCAYQPFVNL